MLTAEQVRKFQRIAGALSPENLWRDGEATRSQAVATRQRLEAEWRALEAEVGRKVSESEVWAIRL